MADLDEIPGAYAVKDQVQTFIDQALVNGYRKQRGLDPLQLNNHLVITGNPGTGKTTMTRQLGQVMYELGMTKSPEVVEIDRGSLAGEFSNQVTQNVTDLITKNRGKVIFIDEAYALYDGPGDRIGKEIVDTLNVLAEKYRNDTSIVLAGYDDRIDEFLQANEGLKSRFPTKLSLPDLTSDEKKKVLTYQVGKAGLKYASPKAQRYAEAYAAKIPSEGDNGNARAVRNFMELMQRTQSARLAASGAAPDADALTSISVADAQEAAARMGLPPIAASVKSPQKAPRRAGYAKRKRRDDVVAV